MRWTALITLVLSLGAFAISWLCAFSGQKPSFLAEQTYGVVSLNTSRIGQTVLDKVRVKFENDPAKYLDILKEMVSGIIEETLTGNGTFPTLSLSEFGLKKRHNARDRASAVVAQDLLVKRAAEQPGTVVARGRAVAMYTEPIAIDRLIVKRDSAGRIDVLGVRDADVKAAAPALSIRDIQDLQERGLLDDIGLGGLINSTSSLLSNATGAITNGLNSLNASWQDIVNVYDTVTDPNLLFAKLSQLMAGFMEEIGVQDFYSFHVAKYCEGQYEPGEMPNATLKLSQIWSNVTGCRSYSLGWKPSQQINQIINKTHLDRVGITNETLGFGDDLDDYVDTAERILIATRWLYIVVIILTGLAALAAIVDFFIGDRSPFIQASIISSLAFIALLLSVAGAIIITVAGRLVTKIVKEKAGEYGVVATKGNGILALAWSLFAIIFLILVLGCVQCCSGFRKRRAARRKYA